MTKISDKISYQDYLQLDIITHAQQLRSELAGKPVHDELFFIINHQTYELWFKQIIAELDSIIHCFQACEDIAKEAQRQHNQTLIYGRLNRINKIMEVLIQQISVIETLTPQSFLEFRNLLTSASGFHSYQFRLLEIRMGILYEQGLEDAGFFSHLAKAQQQQLQAAYDASSLFDCMETWLQNLPCVAKTFWQDYQHSVARLLKQQERQITMDKSFTAEERQQRLKQWQQSKKHFGFLFDPKQYQQLFNKSHYHFNYKSLIAALYVFVHCDKGHITLHAQVLQAVIQLDELFAQWRFHHALMVQRMIGNKVGTGGTAGYSYLQQTVDQNRVFADLANLSTYLICPSDLISTG